MLLLFMEKEVHKPRCIPGASCIFRLLFIRFDADKVMPFGRRRVEPCGNKAAFPWSPAEALLPQGHGQRQRWHSLCPDPQPRGAQPRGGNIATSPPSVPGLGSALRKARGVFGRVMAGEHREACAASIPGRPLRFLQGAKAEHKAGRFLHLRDILQQSMHVAEVSFLESTEVSACVTHSFTNLLCSS